MIGLSSAKAEHHPSAETLAAYAAGTLRAGFDVVAAAHVRHCPHCRAQAAAFERVGGLVLSESEATPVAANALENVLARLDEPERPEPARGLDDLLRDVKRRWVAPGIWVARIDTPHAPDDRVYLLRAAPGMATARHGHHGAEFTLVLSGALADDGVIYRAGDFTERDAADTHHPTAHGDEPCICLFATQGRLAPTGLLGRLAFALADV